MRRRPVARRYDPILVETPAGVFEGLLTVDVLLAEMTRQKVALALQSSPLTGLPGTAFLARRVEALLGAARPFALGWADLDNFKPFNDRYGFARGDAALLLAADVLARHLGGGPDEVLAHAGGDDFAFVVAAPGAEKRARAAIEEFGTGVAALYDARRARGGGDPRDRPARCPPAFRAPDDVDRSRRVERRARRGLSSSRFDGRGGEARGEGHGRLGGRRQPSPSRRRG